MARIRNQANAARGSSFAFVPSVLSVVLFALVLARWAHAAESETMAERAYKKIAERQRDLFAEAAKQGDNVDETSFKSQVQALIHDYELLLRENPKFATGYATYGYLLGYFNNGAQPGQSCGSAKYQKTIWTNSGVPRKNQM